MIDTKARAKKAEKKRKEAESSLPPHLKLDVMKKAFASESSMPNVDPKDRKVIRDRAKTLFKKDLKGTVRGVNEGKSWKDFKVAIDYVRGKKKEMPKPRKADDAGARARRAMQRKEYKSKVSVIVPPELED